MVQEAKVLPRNVKGNLHCLPLLDRQDIPKFPKEDPVGIEDGVVETVVVTVVVEMVGVVVLLLDGIARMSDSLICRLIQAKWSITFV